MEDKLYEQICEAVKQADLARGVDGKPNTFEDRNPSERFAGKNTYVFGNGPYIIALETDPGMDSMKNVARLIRDKPAKPSDYRGSKSHELNLTPDEMRNPESAIRALLAA